MVEFGNNWDPNEEFDDLLGFLDFSIESLEVDELGGDWDISNLQCLGPIPSNLIVGPSTIRNDGTDTWPQNSPCGLVVPINEQLPNCVDASSSHIHKPNKFANVQDSGAFKTQSPVSVLESSGSYLGGKGLSIKSNNAIPVRSRSKRVRPVGLNPWLSINFMKDSLQKVENPGHLKSASSHRSVVIKKCLHCESTKTPQWREGPMGQKTLCNACGVRYRTGRLFPEYRPAKSPTFAPLKHSNSHRKVIEMRNKQPEGIIKITEAPKQKQLSNRVGASTSHICQPNKFATIQESVSVHESRSLLMNPRNKETLQMPELSNHIGGSVDSQESGALETQRPPLSILENRGKSYDNTIPVQSRKRVRPTRFNQSPEKTLSTRRSKEGKKTPFQHPIKVGNLADASWVNRRKCAHCASTKTPQWREGPMGLLLCNACGVRYRKGHLFPEYRPADSPTFVPSKHSNSHKRVIELRKKADQCKKA